MSDEEVKDQQAEEQTKEEEKPDWDKAKQRTDQLEANVRKLTAAREEAEEEKQTLMDKLAEIQTAITQQQEKSKTDLEAVDDALVDPKVARNFQKLADQNKDALGQLAELNKKIKAYEEERTQHQQAEQHKKNVEKILKPLDGMYGEKYRTKAREMADKMVNDEEVPVPADALEAFLLLEKCYKIVKAKDEAATEKKTPTDSGFGGVPFSDSNASTGTRESVLADIRKKGLTGMGANAPIGT
jgi:chromosome segregation ATPase